MVSKVRERSPAVRAKFQCARCAEGTDAPPATARFKGKLCRTCYGKREDTRPRELNDLSGREWAQHTRSVEQYPDTRSEKQRNHGACFPRSLARAHIAMYTKAGQTVLDPFVGVGTTLDACAELKRRGVGIELSEKFARIARSELKNADGGDLQRVIVDDARRMGRHLAPESVDFVLTSPPYGNLLKSVKGAFAYKWREHSELDPVANPSPYSGKPEDLGNMAYPEFLDAIEACLRESRTVLREGRYAAWVVKDFRDMRNGVPYVCFHSHLIERAERVGFSIWDIRVYDQTKFRPLVCLGFPSMNAYLNIGHSYIVILRKR